MLKNILEEGKGVVWTTGLGEAKGNDRQKSCGRERGSMDYRSWGSEG